MSWTLEDDGKVVRIVSGARFKTADLLGALREAIADPRARQPLLLLFDNRVSEENASAEEVQRRVDLFAELIGVFDPRVAIVVSDALHYGIARMGAAYSEQRSFELRVFREVEEARAWLLASSSAQRTAGWSTRRKGG